ncbi:MAG: M23 family metallopeptidase [Planctomycetes bacterium]|nr:M23 family metallopeptidase [Planctomycetota bacterium]
MKVRTLVFLVSTVALVLGPATAPSLGAEFLYPTSGSLSSTYYSSRSYGYHAALDIAAPSGRPIGAARGGTVSYAGWMGGYGNLVRLDHGNGYQTYYAHQSSMAVRVGQGVETGQTIGYVGSTGNSTGPHVHFEIRRWGKKQFIPGSRGNWVEKGNGVPHGYPELGDASQDERRRREEEERRRIEMVRRQRADFHTRFSNVSDRPMLAVQNDDGHLDLFHIGLDKVVYHQWQLAPNQHWGRIEPMPGAPKAQEIVAGRNADGRLEIFYLGLDGIVYHQWQTAANQHWGPVMPMDRSPRARSIALARNSDGRLELFYVAPSRIVFHQWQWAPAGALTPRGYWSDPAPMPGTQVVERVAVALNADGRLEAFYVTPNRAVTHQWQLAPNLEWGKPRAMDGSPLADTIVAAANADGRLEVFYNLAGNIRHQWQLAPGGAPMNGRYWSDPAPIRYTMPFVRGMVVLPNADGRLELFFQGKDSYVHHQWQLAPNDDWGNVILVKGAGQTKKFIGAQNADGRLELFYHGQTGYAGLPPVPAPLDQSPMQTIWHNWQAALDADWVPVKRMPFNPLLPD